MAAALLPKAFPFAPATTLARALCRGEIGAVALLKAYLERVDRHNPKLNAIIAFDRETALRDARAADRARAKGRLLGPLHGLPMTVKESFAITGLPTTFGQPALRNNLAREDALVVQRLKAAGAVVFGKTNVPIHLADVQTYNEIHGTTNNPHDLARGSGGSSGGSAAAVAAGLTALEYGSDIGGSIRNPAAYCGVYGHKPSWSLVPKRGHSPVPWPTPEIDLACVGPLARSAADLALALRVTMGADELQAPALQFRLPRAPRSLTGLRVAAWLNDERAPVDRSVRDALTAAAQALSAAGAKVDFAARPAFDATAAHETYRWLLMAQMGARRPDFDDLLARRLALAEGDRSDNAEFLRMATQNCREHLTQQTRREKLRWAWFEFFQRHDLVLAPITTTAAFVHDHGEPMPARRLVVDGAPRPYFEQLFWAGLATAAMLPATVAPVGHTPEGLPIGAQLIGPEMGDLRTIWAAGQLGRLCGGYRPPPGF